MKNIALVSLKLSSPSCAFFCSLRGTLLLFIPSLISRPLSNLLLLFCALKPLGLLHFSQGD